jgi:hypothetical protein
LASAGKNSSIEGAVEAGRATGLAPSPSFLLKSVTLYNAVVKRLLGIVDEKLALELAREMLSPAVAAGSIEKALNRQVGQQVNNQMARQIGQRVAPSLSQMPANENQNALAR